MVLRAGSPMSLFAVEAKCDGESKPASIAASVIFLPLKIFWKTLSSW